MIKSVKYQSFQLVIQTLSGNTTVSLPLRVGGIYNFVVNYGDGGVPKTVTTYNDANASNLYIIAGTYTISIKGICTKWSCDKEPIVQYIIGINSFGRIKMDTFDFVGCNIMTGITNDERAFRGLNTITDVNNFFIGCTMLPSISQYMFKFATNITTFGSTFENCAALNDIPSELFKYNIETLSFANTFNGCNNLTSVPVDIFRYNVNVTNFVATFNGCNNLTSVPIDIFRYNINVTNFFATFNACIKLSYIPENIFYYNSLVTNYSQTLYDCRNMVLPAVMFNTDNLFRVTDFSSFMYVPNVSYTATGTLQRIDLFSTPSSYGSCITNQTGLTNYNLFPASWGGGG